MLIKKGMLYFLYNPDSNKASVKKEIEIDVIPDSLAHSYNANWEAQDKLGRMSPTYVYKNGSEETYSFSLVMHEDALTGAYANKSLIDFIDDIKSLSYPIQGTENSNLTMPRVYFQIGEIAGYGIVHSTIEWNKPFRNGHYVYVTINFSITIDDKISPMKVSTIKTNNDGSESFYASSKIVSAYTKSQINNIVDSLGGVATFITDIIDPLDAAGLNAIRLGWANEAFDYATQRLNNIYSAFASTSADVSKINFINSLSRTSFGSYQAIASKSNTKDYNKIFDTYIKDFESFVDYYYKDINKDLTDDQRQALKDEFYFIIISIKDLSKEVAGYAASS